MAHVARALVSEAEFLELPETTQSIELLDGEVIVAPSPSYRHQEVLGKLVHALREWAAAERVVDITIGQAPLDVRFGPDRILQPDAFVLLRRTPADLEGPILDVPELCIEVLSTNRTYDRVTKRYVYAEAGVRELWIVEQYGLVERWAGAGLAAREEVTDVLESLVLPGFRLDLDVLRT